MKITHIYVPNSLFLMHACMAILCISSSMGILKPEGVMPCSVGKELSLHRIGHLLNQMSVSKSQKRGLLSGSTKCCQYYLRRWAKYSLCQDLFFSLSASFMYNLAVQCNPHRSRKPVFQTRSLMAFLQLGLPVICKVLL